MGGGQRQLLATCCDFPALLPTAWLMKLPLIISPLPLPGPLPGLSLSVAPPLCRSCCCRSRYLSRVHRRWLYVRNASFIVMARYVRRSLSCRIRLLASVRVFAVRSMDSLLSFPSSFFLPLLLPLLSVSCVRRVCVYIRVLYACALRELLRARANVLQQMGERSIFLRLSNLNSSVHLSSG